MVFTFKRYYSEYIVTGRENIPAEGPVIFAPNHINALMDALAVHSIAPYKLPVIFLARADIFKNRTAAKYLKFVKIMPAFRMQDGMENLGKNNKIFEQCVDILNQNKALGIMPEGNQGEQRKLRPLVKGIFRIAFTAQQKDNLHPNVKIIPVGIDYGDLEKYGKHIIINIGKPIEVSEYMKSYAENTVTATNEIRERLRSDLNKLSLDLATKEYYECFETVVEVANSTYVKKLSLPDNTISRFIARQKIAKRLVTLENTGSEKIEKLDFLCKEYSRLSKKLKLRSRIIEQKPDAVITILLKGLILLCILPVFIYGLLLNFLPFFIPVFVRKYIMKTEYEGFFSSLQFGLGIITFPIFYLLQTLLVCYLPGTSWWMTLIFFCTQYPFGKWAIKWNGTTKKFIAKLKYRKLANNKSNDLLQVLNVRQQIIQLIS
jgi:1-acyl-sn-glycerol-3-phosphate acyltransferase